MTESRRTEFDEHASKAHARIARARKTTLFHVAAAASMVDALKLLRRKQPEAAGGALREVREAVGRLAVELDR